MKPLEIPDGMVPLIVRLNGTNKNPFARYGLTQSPFPQIPKAELHGAMMAINELAGPPIPADDFEAHIRRVLHGWSEEFIQLCILNFKPGKSVVFTVLLPKEYVGE